jgi:23S rRNA (pseudouridine1915-N3)-methyltransferase
LSRAVHMSTQQQILLMRSRFLFRKAEGLPNEMKDGLGNSISLKKRNPILLSLSDLTFTHQFTRLVLIEQIYRATEIRKGSGYHK